MKYALYISKSKGGAQYLDSLDGQVKVSREGSFKAFPFLVLPSNEMAAISINQKTGDVKRIRSRSPVFSWSEAMI